MTFITKSFQTELKKLIHLSLPLTATGLISSAIYFFITLFLAKFGPSVLAAGALVSWMEATVIVIIFGLLSAVNVLVAHKYGARDNEGMSKVLGDGFLLAIIISVPLMILYWYMSPIFLYMGQRPEIEIYAAQYLHALAPGILPTFFVIVILEFLMGLGHAKLTLYFNMILSAFIITLAYLLIFGHLGLPRLGIAGAGWALTIGYTCACVVFMIYVITKKEYFIYFKKIFKNPHPSTLKQIIFVGLPLGCMYSMEVGFFFVLSLLIGHLGIAMLAANQIVMQYLGIFSSLIFSLAQGVTIRLGHLLGGKDFAPIQTVIKVSVFMSMSMACIILCIYVVLPKPLLALMLDLNDPKNIEIVHYALAYLFFCGLFQWIEAIRITLFGALRGFKDTRFSLLTSAISFWVISLPLGYYFSTFSALGGSGYWLALVFGAAISTVMLACRLKKKIYQL